MTYLEDEMCTGVVIHPPIVSTERRRDAVILALILSQLLTDGNDHAPQRPARILFTQRLKL